MRKLISISCLLAASVATAERQSLDRYQSVISKQMFGRAPDGFDPTKMPEATLKTKLKADKELTQEQERVKKSIRFSVLNITPSDEVVVGFTDSGDPKNPLHYYLKVGESQNGWTVKEADKNEGTMTVEKDGIEVTLKLGGDSATDANAVARTGAAAESVTESANTRRKNPLLGGGTSLRDRRRQREEQIRAEESAKHAEEDKARVAREEAASQQREAEREEQRKQLQQIQEELRKAREAREAAEKAESEKNKTTEAETTTNEAQ